MPFITTGPASAGNRPPAMPAASTVRTWVMGVRLSWVPPAAPNAMPASAAPRISAAIEPVRSLASGKLHARLGALATEPGERDTRDLGDERDASQRGHAVAQRHNS